MKIITPKDIAELLKKSIWWVYAHAEKLGGAKIAGAWIFTEENLINAIQRGQEMARISSECRSKIYDPEGLKKRGERMGKRNSKEIEKSRAEAARRAGLAEFLQ